MSKKCGKWGVGIVFVYVLLAGAIIGLVVMIPFSVKEMKLRKIPTLEIVLDDATLDEVNKGEKETIYYNNQMVLKTNNEKNIFEKIEFKGRGNASWRMDKKSYRVEIGQKHNLLGLGKVKKWGLISNGIDGSSLRNDLAYYMGNLIDDDYQIKGDFVRLIIDKQDLGLYYMTKLVGIGKSTVDLRNEKGIIVELDNAYCTVQDTFTKTDILNDCLVLGDVVKEDKEQEEIWKNFVMDYNAFETAVIRGDYEEASKFVDMNSLVNYYLLGEFASNPDMCVTSWHMYKDGENDKIHSVLAWDFDAAFGNKRWFSNTVDDFYLPYNTMSRLKYSFQEKENYEEGKGMGCRYNEGDDLASLILCYAIDMPEFKEEVNRAYKEKLQNKREEIIDYIKDRADYIREAAIQNNEIWDLGDFDEAVDYLIWWVEERFNYFDENYVDASAAIEL